MLLATARIEDEQRAALLDQFRQEQPEADSPAELDILRRFGRLAATRMRELGPWLPDTLMRRLAHDHERLSALSARATTPMLQRATASLEEALEPLGWHCINFARMLADASADEFERVITSEQQAYEPGAELSAERRTALRASLHLTLAMDAIDGAPEELLAWSLRAATSAALLPKPEVPAEAFALLSAHDGPPPTSLLPTPN